MAPTDLGLRIRRARERKRWNQQQLADAIGVGVRSVGRWERGTVPRNAIGALEHVLNVDLSSAVAPDPVVESILALPDLDPGVARKLVALYQELTVPAAPPAVPPASNGGQPHSTTG